MHTPKRARIVLPPQSVDSVSILSEYPRRVTIEELSDEVLLNIFRHYLDPSLRFWPGLVHICRKWRRIIFASQRALHLGLFCTHGTPVSKTLDCWTALPIIVQYGGSPTLNPPAPEDHGNIVAALKQSGRVTSIGLTVTRSLLAKFLTIKEPFSELEELILLSESRDSKQLALPSAFQWGPRLRRLRSTGIAFPALLRRLSPSRNLVDIQLHDISINRHLSPKALVNTLSGMAQLQSLSLHFLSTTHHTTKPPRPGEHVVLPALTRLNLRGTTTYFEDLFARVDAPRLRDIEITLLDEPISGISNLRKFIDRTEIPREIQKSHRQADFIFSEHSASISLTKPLAAPTCFKLQLLSDSSSQHLSSMTEICSHFSAFLLSVEDLRISATGPSSRQNDRDREQWLGLIHRFKCAKWLYVPGKLSKNIVFSLPLSDMGCAILLPALNKLRMTDPAPSPSPDAEASATDLGRLSGHITGAEYELERLWTSDLRGTGLFSQQVTLSDDVFLNIFRHYLYASPQFWPTLTHVCQRWRKIVFTSPLGLDLRLYCTYGTPVLKTLDCWPALPISVQYVGFPTLSLPAPGDEDNIMAALNQSDRIVSIGLTVTNSLLENLSTISEPFRELEELVLLSQDDVQLTLPSAFRRGPRLRTLHSTGIAFPSLPQLLSPSQDLVDIQLQEIPSDGYFSPEELANALTAMTQLRTLSIHFLSFPPRRTYLGLPPPSGEHVVLPALTRLKYRGTSKYLDSFVARIDAPRLGDIDITLFSQPTLDASQLGRFIDRIDILGSHSQANIRTSEQAISISFTNSSASTLRLQISCKQLDWQLYSMAQVCDKFSPFLSRVESVGINTTQSPSGQDAVDCEQWLELVRSFGLAKDLTVTGELTTEILCALGPADEQHATLLPALLRLHVEEPMARNVPSWDAVLSFTTSRWLAGRPVQVYAREYSCHICSSRYGEPTQLEMHLLQEHAYRVVCSYCRDFECTLGHNRLFQEHLESKHPEVVRNCATIS